MSFKFVFNKFPNDKKNPDMHARRGRRERFKMSRGREIDSMS